MYSRILVPIDGSEHAHNGLKVGSVLAEHYNSKIILLCVADEDIPEDEVEAAINEGIIRPSSYQEFISTLDHPNISARVAAMLRQIILSRVASAIANEIAERCGTFAKAKKLGDSCETVRIKDHPRRRNNLSG